MVLVIVVAAGASVYLGMVQQQQDEQLAELKSQAIIAVGRVSVSLKGMRNIMDGLAADQGLSLAIKADGTIADGTAISAWVATQQSNIDGLLKLRVLGLNHILVDRASTPPMGYAGLEMLRAAEKNKKPQKPEVHMMGSENQHLAFVSPIIEDGVLRGLLLASFDVNNVQKAFKFAFSGEQTAWYELKQGGLVVAGNGDHAFRKVTITDTIPILKTRWRVVIRKSFVSLPVTQEDILTYAGLLLTLLLLLGPVTQTLTDKEKRSKLKKALKKKPKKTSGEQGNEGQALSDEGESVPKLDIDLDLTASQNPIFQQKDAIEVSTQLSVQASIFRAYDIRGIVDDTLTESGVYEIGRAIGSAIIEAEQTNVVIARDGRLHSLRLSKSLAKGLQATGCNVIDVGQVPTPILYFATHNTDANSGVMITGSHNPAEYNGLKVVVNGDTLSGKAITNLFNRIQSDDLTEGEGGYHEQMMLPEYIGAISSDVKMGRMMKVVVDCGNGVAGEAVPMLLSTLGCEVVPLYCEIDGNFPNHHPDPSKPENLQVLIDTVKQEEAELGLAFDGDGDRLGVVDSEGNVIWPDRQMMLYAADVLSRQAGADIIFDVKCTKNLAKFIAKHGGKPVMSKTGHSLIKAKMKETKAELGGEMSGHIFFKERWFGFDDALYTAARLLEIVSAEFRSTAEIFAELPNSLSTPELQVSLLEGENFSFIDKLIEQASFDDAKLITIDGLRVEYADGWGLVRASNTTPSLVLRFEADDEAALARIQEVFRIVMMQVKPDIELPF